MVFSAEVFEFLTKLDLTDVESTLKTYQVGSMIVSDVSNEEIDLTTKFSDLKLEKITVSGNVRNEKFLSGFYRNDRLTWTNFDELSFPKVICEKTPFRIIEHEKKNYLIISVPFQNKQKRKSTALNIAQQINELLFGNDEMIIRSKQEAETTTEQ